MPDDDFERFQNKPAGRGAVAVSPESERNANLRAKLAAKNVECQALRARVEIDRFRHQMRVDDLEKQLALREAEIVRLKQVLEQLIAEVPEHADQPENAVRVATSGPQTVFVTVDSADTAELRGQLQSAREEYEKLRQATDNSLALKVARSIGRLLGKGAKQ